MIARLVVAFTILLVPAGALAQPTGGSLPVSVGGEVGSYVEMYGISGAEQRRPGETGRLYVRPSFSLYDKFTVGVDLLLSTEGETFRGDSRQRLNQYSINPSWGWGDATLGDFTDTYSPLTFNGIRVRGASVEVRGGPFVLATFGGRALRSIVGGATTGSYSRTVAGGRIGVGDPSRTSLALTVVRARDDVGSLEAPTDTLFPDVQPDTAFVEDTLQVGLENQFAVTPQENLVIGIAGTHAFGDLLAVKGELAVSAYTRDLRSDKIDSEDILDRIPGVVQTLYTPRVSSSGDYAYTLEARLRPTTPLTTTVTYRYIGPGYTSLGVASLLSDRREVDVRTSLQFRRFRASFSAGHQNDDLIDQKMFTTGRDRFSGSVSVRLTRHWTTSARVNRATLGNDATEQDRFIAYGSWMAATRQTFTFGRRSFVRSTSVDYGYRTTGDDNPLRAMSTSRAHSINASMLLAPRRNLTITPTVGVVRSRFAEAEWSTRTTYGLGTQLSLVSGKWVSSLNLARSQLQQTVALQAMLSSRYQVTQRDAVILSLRGSNYDNITDPNLSFREAVTNLRWAHRF